MRFSVWLGISALLMAHLAPPAYAENMTGTELFAKCTAAAGSVAHKQCRYYIAGVVDGADTLIISLRLLHPSNGVFHRLYCLPSGVDAKSLVSPIIRYLRNHPLTRHYGAASEVLLALKQAYPCHREE